MSSNTVHLFVPAISSNTVCLLCRLGISVQEPADLEIVLPLHKLVVSLEGRYRSY